MNMNWNLTLKAQEPRLLERATASLEALVPAGQSKPIIHQQTSIQH